MKPGGDASAPCANVPRMLRKKRSRYAASEKLFAAASRILPGGVDSPVRAFKAVGATPLFIERGRGAYIEDADGHTYIDYVMSWGPLIHGHAPKGLVKALAAAAARGTSFGAPTAARDQAGAAVSRADAVDGAGAVRQLGHRGDDERGAGGARVHRSATRSSSSRAATTVMPTRSWSRPVRAR